MGAAPAGLAAERGAPGSARRSVLDRLGIGVSLACAVHCVLAALLAAAPAFAATAAPGLGEGFEHLEAALLWIALGVGALALVPAYVREHRRPAPLVLFALGLGLVASVRTVELEALEVVGTVTGVVLIAGAHLLNLRARPHCHAGDGAHCS